MSSSPWRGIWHACHHRRTGREVEQRASPLANHSLTPLPLTHGSARFVQAKNALRQKWRGKTLPDKLLFAGQFGAAAGRPVTVQTTHRMQAGRGSSAGQLAWPRLATRPIFVGMHCACANALACLQLLACMMHTQQLHLHLHLQDCLQ